MDSLGHQKEDMKVEGNMLGSRMMLRVGIFKIHCVHEWNCQRIKDITMGGGTEKSSISLATGGKKQIRLKCNLIWQNGILIYTAG